MKYNHKNQFNTKECNCIDMNLYSIYLPIKGQQDGTWKKKPMVQVHKRETLLHNKNRITHLKKKLYKKLHTITFLYICLCTYACTFLNIIHHNGSTESCCNVCWKIFT